MEGEFWLIELNETKGESREIAVQAPWRKKVFTLSGGSRVFNTESEPRGPLCLRLLALCCNLPS